MVLFCGDFAKLTLEFQHEGKTVSLQGLHSLLHKCVDSDRMVMVAFKSHHGFLFQMTSSAVYSQLASSADEIQQLNKLLLIYNDLFQEMTSFPPVRKVDHRIPILPGTAHVAVRTYQYPHYKKLEIKNRLKSCFIQGLIGKVVAPPVLLVLKKEGTWRMCVDYRALNKTTVKDKFPIPNIDELLDELHGANFFSKLDLRPGYHQIRMHDDYVYKTAFRTHHGHYEFLVMPFGLYNAPSTFQALMNDLFKDFLRKSVLVFFDDILEYSSTWSSHLRYL